MSGQRLKDQVIIITGASGGLGEEMAKRAAKDGAKPILIARSADKLAKIQAEILAEYKIEAPVYVLDVSRREQIIEVFERILEAFPVIDVLVNNAGFGVFDYFHEASLEDMSGMFEVNVLGLMACTRLIVPGMIEKRHGHIINIASIAGKLATPKSTIYSATKHAVLGFTNGLRMELSEHNVQVTAVNPGPIQTDFFNRADPEGSYVQNVYSFMIQPGYVADKVIRAIGTNKREINLPWTMSTGAKLYQLFPWLVEMAAGSFLRKK